MSALMIRKPVDMKGEIMKPKITKAIVIEGRLGPFEDVGPEVVGIFLSRHDVVPEHRPSLLPAATPQAKPPRKKDLPDWRHPESESPPEEFQVGYVEGSLKDIASWLYADGLRDSRRLPEKVKNGTIWIQDIHTRLHRVWFRHEGDYQSAKRRASIQSQRGSGNVSPQSSGNATSVKRHEETRDDTDSSKPS
jgi:hypothetical protein